MAHHIRCIELGHGDPAYVMQNAPRLHQPGMLTEIAARFNASLTDVPAIGDSLRDLQAAQEVGAKPVLVLTGKGKKTLADPLLPRRTPNFPDLASAVAQILKNDPS